ncbi:DNA translocase FtsK [Ligilactobacillus aviarius]|uniref:DNA translocase FtsK n=1 Tax=Ligilactobacillus aviarius TaxID=1606 RepID=UPI00249D9E19|nr:DNA translocase FtsK [Ligilactobacillus aviarius]
MEHYDGPAFFRRQPVEKPRKKINNHPAEGLRQTEDSHREFHPSYIPPSVLTLGSKNLKEKYRQLVTEITKANEDYLLFDDAVNSSDAVDLLHFTPESAVDDEPQKEEQVSSQADPEPVESGLAESSLEKNENEVAEHQLESVPSSSDESETSNSSEDVQAPDHQIDDDEFEQVKSEADEVSVTETESKPHEEDNSSKSDTDELAPETDSSVDDSMKAESVIEEPEQKPVDAEDHLPEAAVTEPTSSQSPVESQNDDLSGHALSKSLGDIMNEENNAQRNLKIFDSPKSEPISVTDSHANDHGRGYQLPPLSLLPEPVGEDSEQTEEWALNQADILNETFKAFNVDAQVKDWTVGPTVTQFEVTLALGVKVSKITNLADDLKLALAAKDIRIEAPIAGKSSVGIEIPNKFSRPVMLSEVLNSPQFKNARSPLTVALGVDLFGIPQVTNIHDMPHGLIAGATGSGKSVFINSLLISLLYKATPEQVKLLLIDPKTVELAPYSELPHLLAPVISDPQAATASLKWAVEEMNNRYEKLAAAGVRDIDSFNAKVEETGEYGLHMPYIVIIIDELADLMMTASAEIADYIGQITAKARACGIHLLVATQRPSVDVITGTMKNNIPTRIAFMVSSQVDSRTIIDSAGAEKLLGRGDMLYLGNGKSQPVRLQGTYINDDKIDEIVDFVKKQGKPHYAFDPDNLKKKELNHENEDELLPRVLEYIVNEETTSTSKLQRVFSIGYNRAARIIEELEKKQYISPAHGSKPRKVFLTEEELDKMQNE